MNRDEFKYVYGPVPSKRLNRSLGVDLVPFKTCSYDCIYCQLGRTTNKTVERKNYVAVEDVLMELERKLSISPHPDYISFAGSGEPTLSKNIGDLINMIKGLTQIPIAVLTNGSMLWSPEVQDALMDANIVLPSLDAGDEKMFCRVNRPHPSISFEKMLNGMITFSKRFSGSIWLEVFLLGGLSDAVSEVSKIAAAVLQVNPDRVQLNTVSRPPAEDSAFTVETEKMEEIKRLFPGEVELITNNVSDLAPATQRNDADDLEILALLQRRPCTTQDIAQGLEMNASDVNKRLQFLDRKCKIRAIRRNGAVFYETVESEKRTS